MNMWFVEDETPGYKLHWRLKKVLHEEKTKYQYLQVVELEDFGKTLILDDAIQITEKDEYIYNEMISHVPLITHPNPQRVLIIGGGDGGAAREVLKHPQVKEVDMVEIDEGVINAIKKFFPELAGVFNEERLNLFIDDGINFVKNKTGIYDVIIVDSSDPVGPAVQLFEAPFYKDCFNALKEDGILNIQSESPFFNMDVIAKVNQILSSMFAHVNTYLACVPTYPSGLWSFTMASKKYKYSEGDLKRARRLNTKYFSEEIFSSCFALPAFVKESIEGR